MKSKIAKIVGLNVYVHQINNNKNKVNIRPGAVLTTMLGINARPVEYPPFIERLNSSDNQRKKENLSSRAQIILSSL